jgi:hypothetical protein
MEAAGKILLRSRAVEALTTAQINALLAPRPHLATAGNRDNLTPAGRLGPHRS